MKKNLLMLCAAVLFGSLAAFAQIAETDTLSYCGGDYFTGIATGDMEHETGLAIEIPAATAVQHTGSKIKKVRIAIGTPCTTSTLRVFIGESFDVDPVYTEEFEITVRDGWNEFELTTPYLVTGTEFVVGYTLYEESMDDWPLGVSFVQENQSANGNYIALYNNQTGRCDWVKLSNLGGEYAYVNVCIEALLEPGEMPKNNAAFNSVTSPYYMKTGETYEFYGSVTNGGTDDITSLEVTYTLGDDTPIVATIDNLSIAPGKTRSFAIPGAVYTGEAGVKIPLQANITKVNGEVDPFDANNYAETNFWSGNDTFSRVVVLEEMTGTWCGACPIGMVCMDYMKEKYPDSFIGIAVHGGGYDPMETFTYTDYIPGDTYPNSHMNRYYNHLYPSIENVEAVYNMEVAKPVPAKITLTSSEFVQNNTSLKVTAETEFSLDVPSANYRIAYVVLENHVGPYEQSNYYSGSSEPMGGWESKPDYVKGTFYDDVARNIFSYYGVRNSVANKIVKGEKYTHTYTLSIENVSDINNVEVVALLLDYDTEEIINADKLTSFEISGVEDIAIDEDVNAPAAFYNLQGCEVDSENLAPGIYIKRQGKQTEKLIIR